MRLSCPRPLPGPAPGSGPRSAAARRTARLRRLAPTLALLLAACGGSEPAAVPPPAAPEVGVVTLAPQPLVLQTVLNGRTVAVETAEIRPQVGGIVRERLFTEGGRVRAGQVLYRIDEASYRASLASAEAAVARAEATLQAATLKAERQQALLAAHAGSRQDAEDAVAAMLQARAELQTARAAEASARLDLERTRVVSPIAGRIDTSAVTVGALVTAQQATAMSTVQAVDPMWVDLPQSSAELLALRRQLAEGRLKDGAATVRLRLEDGSDYAHTGRLQVQGVTVDAGTGAVTLRARVPNPAGLLLPGMVVRAVIDQARDPAALLVPQAGVQRGSGGEATALVVEADGTVAARSLRVAEALEGRWRVLAGLAAGDRVIVEGSARVRPGQIVHAVPAGTATAQAAPAAAAR